MSKVEKEFKKAIETKAKELECFDDDVDYAVFTDGAQTAYDWCSNYMVTDRHVKRLKELGEKITECVLQKRVITRLKKKLETYCSCSVSMAKCDVCVTMDEVEKMEKV